MGALLLVSRTAAGAGAADIERAALATKKLENLQTNESKILLYGQRTNGSDTKYGQWACAKVVSIVLRKAGVKMDLQLGVGGIERSLKTWKRIGDSDDLKPGDVVVWTSRTKGNANRSCTGGGTCHVGIYTSDGYFHNDPRIKKPSFDGISLWAFKFKVGLRPPAR